MIIIKSVGNGRNAMYPFLSDDIIPYHPFFHVKASFQISSSATHLTKIDHYNLEQKTYGLKYKSFKYQTITLDRNKE